MRDIAEKKENTGREIDIHTLIERERESMRKSSCSDVNIHHSFVDWWLCHPRCSFIYLLIPLKSLRCSSIHILVLAENHVAAQFKPPFSWPPSHIHCAIETMQKRAFFEQIHAINDKSMTQNGNQIFHQLFFSYLRGFVSVWKLPKIINIEDSLHCFDSKKALKFDEFLL